MIRIVGTLILCTLSAVANAQTYPSFRDVDFFYSQQPQVFEELREAARTQTIRIAVLGDSQETSPQSRGFQYLPLLNYEMWKRFGNSPETPVVGCFQYGSTPPAHWLLAGQCTSPGPSTTRLSATQILPNARPRAFSTLNAATNITGGNRGQLTLLQHDASGIDASAGIPTEISYFNTSGIVKAQIFAATHPGSGEIAYQARPNATPSPSYAAAVTTTGTLALGLQSPEFAIRSGRTVPLEFNGNHYMALEVLGASDTQLTDLIGLRFINESHPQGVVVDSLSLGGYTAERFLNLHANAGPMFAAFGFHAAILHYGANEGGSISAASFAANLSAVIARVRSWVGDPAFPVILIADVYQSRPSAEQTAEYDRYVGAQLTIAQADPNVMVINARRLTENIGWNARSGQSSLYLNDGVHYTGLGAQTLALSVVSALMGEIHTTDCPSDPGSVSLQSGMTLVVELGGTTACTEYGRLTVAQSLTLNQPALQVSFANDFVPAAGDEFKLLSFANLTGSFGSVALPALPAGLFWNTDRLYSDGTIAVELTPAPEPQDPPDSPAPPTIPPSPSPDPGVGGGSGNNSGSGSNGGGTLDVISLTASCLLVLLMRLLGQRSTSSSQQRSIIRTRPASVCCVNAACAPNPVAKLLTITLRPIISGLRRNSFSKN